MKHEEAIIKPKHLINEAEEGRLESVHKRSPTMEKTRQLEEKINFRNMGEHMSPVFGLY